MVLLPSRLRTPIAPTVDDRGTREIQHTPGADRTSSLAFITNFGPGSYLLHDHLHMRGGHQVSWLVDGVPIPNANISSNVGRALDPKDRGVNAQDSPH